MHNNQQSSEAIAVVGLGCRYPGATGPRELWENVLARRQQFRQMPDCRLPLEDYYDSDPKAPDKTYGRKAAVLDGFEFDWKSWRIPKATVEGTDIAQWLALDVAAQCLEDASYTRETTPRERTGVILGNTLTGEHTRANTMRTRWPFVRRALLTAAASRGMSSTTVEQLANQMEPIFKSVFPPVTEDTLAGGLSNTIAGRIANAFDLHGGGYTIDGACSSSLLAVCTAANALSSGDLDLALAGGVDISLDTFELIGFAKTGALTPDEMRVYDRRGNGFLPGEGCGFVALKRLEDARRDGDFVYAVLHGWGISSDGKGGLTAPRVEGQARALRRAYQRAGYSPATLHFIEGHGTGTRVGDRVELEAIAKVVNDENPPAPVGVTSFKSIVGHTKAAAGVGAFIKTVIALNRRVIPPTAGCQQPNDIFQEAAQSLYPITEGKVLSTTATLRAGVSAMGFGGINSHVTLESGDAPSAKFSLPIEESKLLASQQTSEIFPFDADTQDGLRNLLLNYADLAELLSQAELTDLAAFLSERLAGKPIRAAVVADSPEKLARELRRLAESIGGHSTTTDAKPRHVSSASWIGQASGSPRLGFLIPGQASQQLQMARVLLKRSAWARELANKADAWLDEMGCPPVAFYLDCDFDGQSPAEIDHWRKELARTEIAQPALCLASLLQARHLELLGLKPAVVAGHSLGELTAFHLAGAFDAEQLIKLAGLRGRLMAEAGAVPGTMASLSCSKDVAERLRTDLENQVVIANVNSPRQTVVSGEVAAVQQVVQRAEEAGIATRMLSVSGAFHSPVMNSAAESLRQEATWLDGAKEWSVELLTSTTGKCLQPDVELNKYFAQQITAPVDFIALVENLAAQCDQLIEVGPGRVLSHLATDILKDRAACLPVMGRMDSQEDLQTVLARAYVAGVNVHWCELYRERAVRPFVPASDRKFLDNPCERPFAIPQDSAEISDEAHGELERALLAATGIQRIALETYLNRRRGFLCEVVKADLSSLNGSLVKLPAETVRMSRPIIELPAVRETSSPTQPTTEKEPATEACPPNTEEGLEQLVRNLAAERTGFPPETLAGENRLLDDLNLDSIKAAELVAEAAKQQGVAGKIDPSQYANASLAEVAAALAVASGKTDESSSEESSPPLADATPASGEIHWVRNFAVEYVEVAS